jgi:hypothetical protein
MTLVETHLRLIPRACFGTVVAVFAARVLLFGVLEIRVKDVERADVIRRAYKRG